MKKKRTILYVDDEEINLLLFEINFKEKYNVIGTDSPAKGLLILKSNHDISVVISDMRMPNMNGIQFIKKAKKKFPKICYFILTGYDITDEISDALDSKLIVFYFKKPFNMKEIDNSIEKVFSDNHELSDV
ncbi:MAG: response regulator [Chlorobi bacterium]|nr:response regulator [Chlorobiota bacterium]